MFVFQSLYWLVSIFNDLVVRSYLLCVETCFFGFEKPIPVKQ